MLRLSFPALQRLWPWPQAQPLPPGPGGLRSARSSVPTCPGLQQNAQCTLLERPAPSPATTFPPRTLKDTPALASGRRRVTAPLLTLQAPPLTDLTWTLHLPKQRPAHAQLLTCKSPGSWLYHLRWLHLCSVEKSWTISTPTPHLELSSKRRHRSFSTTMQSEPPPSEQVTDFTTLNKAADLEDK